MVHLLYTAFEHVERLVELIVGDDQRVQKADAVAFYPGRNDEHAALCSQALSCYKGSLKTVLGESTAEHDLKTERSESLADFTFFTVIGTAGEILESVQDLRENGVGGFVVVPGARRMRKFSRHLVLRW